MRITVVGALGPGQLADSLAYGFRSLERDVASVSDESLKPRRRVTRLLTRRWPEVLRWSRSAQQQETAQSVIATRPDLVLAVKSPYLHGAAIERIRRHTGARILNWYPDNPFVHHGQRTPSSALRHYDGVVVFSPQLADRVRKEIGVASHYIPFGFDPRYYFPAPRPRHARVDVAFVGAYRPERAALVSTLLDAGFSVRVAGPHWERASRTVRSAWQTGATWGADAGRLYHEARVGLNELHAQSNAHSHNMRTWEIPATGTPMATTDSAHQRQLLQGISGVGYYAGAPDLPTTVERLIAESRDEAPSADLSAHTYAARCQALLAAC